MNKYFRIIIWLVFLIGGMALAIYLDKHVFEFERLEKGLLYYLVWGSGIILFVLSFNATGNVGRALAKGGRSNKNLPRMQTDQLLTSGIYSLMRHPMNQALLGFPMAIALIGVSPSFIFIIAPLEILLMIIMIVTIEESETRKKFGKAYDDYCAKTPRFCIKWKCLKALLKNSYKNN